MLEFKLDGNILRVIESIHSFKDTKKRYWYYDILNWKKNRNGHENEVIDLECDSYTQYWVKKYYFSKVGLTA